MRAWFAARPWKRAAGWLAVLGPLFYLTYGLANWWATTRAQVPSMAFAWERQVPFWPWTIFPYWTINVFYALSLFLARDRHTLDRHGARLVSATLIACSCFVIWPLHFSFGQPAVEGAPAFLFAALRGFDQPYNQAPSLHIALAVILWDWYRQFIRPRWARLVLHLWAFAICASVLTTWQHHFIDIPTGALLGLVCIWLWPLQRTVSLPRAWRLARNPRRWKLAACYALGALACLALALWGGGWALWLAWPAASLALVALNYAGFGARGFQMDGQGRMGWAARWLFAPYRLGAALNARLWTRGLPPAAEVVPGLWLGRLPTPAEWQAAGRPRLVSLCAELQVPSDAAGARCVP
ncbi:phosphatase PAP2 family protein, partial [Variovorax sp.]